MSSGNWSRCSSQLETFSGDSNFAYAQESLDRVVFDITTSRWKVEWVRLSVWWMAVLDRITGVWNSVCERLRLHVCQRALLGSMLC